MGNTLPMAQMVQFASTTTIEGNKHITTISEQYSQYPTGSFSINRDGWLWSPRSGELVLWVPPKFLSKLYSPGTVSIIGTDHVKTAQRNYAWGGVVEVSGAKVRNLQSTISINC